MKHFIRENRKKTDCKPERGGGEKLDLIGKWDSLLIFCSSLEVNFRLYQLNCLSSRILLKKKMRQNIAQSRLTDFPTRQPVPTTTRYVLKNVALEDKELID